MQWCVAPKIPYLVVNVRHNSGFISDKLRKTIRFDTLGDFQTGVPNISTHPTHSEYCHENEGFSMPAHGAVGTKGWHGRWARVRKS